VEIKSETFQLEIGLVDGRYISEATALTIDRPLPLVYFFKCPSCHHQVIHNTTGPVAYTSGHLQARPGFELQCSNCQTEFILIQNGDSYNTDEWAVKTKKQEKDLV
jgi:transcription elongation factor Elf1